MADLIIDKNAKKPETAPQFQGYSRVVIDTDTTDEEGKNIVYTAGDRSGRTLTVKNPWGNQTTAEAILQRIRGWAYQPVSADSALLNPAEEIGDSMIVDDIFSGVYKQTQWFAPLFHADVEAPFEEELDHEYTFERQEERAFTRKVNDAVARLNFFADRIDAKVDRTNAGTSFGWSLTDSSWNVFNQNGTIFSINASGAYVKGEIQADSGLIGGFNIGPNALYKDITSMSDEQHNGVYIGTDGISLGKGRFKVDSAGNLTAASGSFSGAVYASNIKTDAQDGYGGSFPGSGITGNSLGRDQFVGTVNNSLDYANFSNSVFNSNANAKYMHATTMYGTYLSCSQFAVDDKMTIFGMEAKWKSSDVVTWVGQEQNWAWGLTRNLSSGAETWQKVLLYSGTNVLSSDGSIKHLAY